MNSGTLIAPSKKGISTSAVTGLLTTVLYAMLVAALYFGKDFLVPLALAALLTLMLSPLAGLIERLIGRVAAVFLVVALVFVLFGTVGWVIIRQAADMAGSLPDYRYNIEKKLHSIEPSSDGPIKRFSQMVVDIETELPGLGNGPAVANESQHPKPSAPAAPAKPQANPLDQVRWMVGPLLGALGTFGIVMVLVIFMLLKREDLRGRVIKIIGGGRISSTSRALEDAGDRVWHYLVTQLCVNVTFGVIIGFVLYFIGVPTAFLWGALAAILRFVPYIGIWIAAFCPVLIALAVSPGWNLLFLTLGVFFVMELVTANFIEPFLYRSSTGVSSLALIVAALFWTWLWGPVGLLLSTPVTVCMAVLGKHIPGLSFLRVLLGDEEPLKPGEECYHRLLVGGFSGAGELFDSWVKSNSLIALFDEVLVPTVTMAELDYHREELEDTKRDRVLQGVHDIIEDLYSRPPAEPKLGDFAVVPEVRRRIVCIPARSLGDEVTAAMLVHLFRQSGHDAVQAPAGDSEAKMLIGEHKADTVFISLTPPSSIIHARHLCSRLRAHYPKLIMIVGIWGTAENLEEISKGLSVSGADAVVSSMEQALTQFEKFKPA